MAAKPLQRQAIHVEVATATCLWRDPPRRTAFTLVEMLVVIAVIGVLLGLILPTLAGIRAESRSTVCLSNLRQIFAAVDIARQQRKDLLPFAAPLPPVTNRPVIPGLPEVLSAIIPPQAEVWMCPGDTTEDVEELGASYVYLAGAFMIPELGFLPPPPKDPNDPPPPPLSPQALIERATRLVTHRYTRGYLRSFPLLADSADNHDSGGRLPWNAVFIDGNARLMRPGDDEVATPPNP